MREEKRQLLEKLYSQPLLDQFRNDFWKTFKSGVITGLILIGINFIVLLVIDAVVISLAELIGVGLLCSVFIGLVYATVPYIYFALTKPYYLRKLDSDR